MTLREGGGERKKKMEREREFDTGSIIFFIQVVTLNTFLVYFSYRKHHAIFKIIHLDNHFAHLLIGVCMCESMFVSVCEVISFDLTHAVTAMIH